MELLIQLVLIATIIMVIILFISLYYFMSEIIQICKGIRDIFSHISEIHSRVGNINDILINKDGNYQYNVDVTNNTITIQPRIKESKLN